MQGFQSRLERLELKYVVDDVQAASVIRDLAPYCAPDSYNFGRNAGVRPGYWIQSLYLDTPSLAFHRAKERGDPDRFKLRLRRYNGTDTQMMELKKRSKDVIEKTRAVIQPEDLEQAARGYAKLREETPRARSFVDRFAGLVLASGAEPAMLVRYRREAYHTRGDGYARVTFDRELCFQRVSDWHIDGRPDAWTKLEDHLAPGAPRPLVVLEVKCETSVPHWVVDLIRQHNLQRRSFSKYSIGIYLTGWLNGSPPGGRSLRGVLA